MIDFKQDEGLSFLQMQDKYKLSREEVVRQYCEWRDSICNPQLMIKMLQEQIQELVATIEAQEIIIKDKSDIIEAMAQPKTCETCKHCITTHSIITSTPICGHDENIQFYLDDQPMQTSEGFYCNKYEPKAQP